VEGLPGLGSSPLDIVIRTLVVYVAVVFGLRIGGKREVGQLGTVDLVALLLLANAVQNAMVGTDSSLAGGLISGMVILLSTRVLDMLTRRSAVVRRLVVGESRVLIENGHVNRKAMAHEQISDDELQEALHEHGLEYRREVRRATLEVDGSISIIPMPEAADHFQAGGGPESSSRRGGRVPRRSAARSQRFATDVLPPPAEPQKESTT
jgi:uncharacterized membrane protein YcaP (DUF421 family)